MLITYALVQATPAHVYKSFPPEHSAFAEVPKEKSVPSEKPEPKIAVKKISSKPKAKVATQTEKPAPKPAPPACGSDPNMAYIYKVESGCRTSAYNYLGCRGLGQACPGTKLPCSDNDWTCQNDWFVTYAIERYGSTYNAYLFRVSHNWW